MKLDKVVVYKLKMCVKEINPGPKNIKGDNLREIIMCVGHGVLLVN